MVSLISYENLRCLLCTDLLMSDTGQVLLNWDFSSTNKTVSFEMTKLPLRLKPLAQTLLNAGTVG